LWRTILTAEQRSNAALMSTVGKFAAIIGSAGVYVTMAFLAAEQVRAIGPLMALGASPSEIVRGVLRRALQQVVWESASALVGAGAASHALPCFVFDMRAARIDPTTVLKRYWPSLR
jgi:hypothetical protein